LLPLLLLVGVRGEDEDEAASVLLLLLLAVPPLVWMGNVL
jgi:hypothetical protein